MTTKISIANEKGGTGKTTTAINLAYSLTELENAKVLIVDLDSQTNVTNAFKFDRVIDKSIMDLMLDDDINNKETIYTTNYDSIDVVASVENASDINLRIADEIERELILSRQIVDFENDYDYIILDCSPSKSLMVVNALAASDFVVSPAMPSMFDIQGAERINKLIELIKENLNENLKNTGVLLTSVDNRSNLSDKIFNYVKNKIEVPIYNTKISQSVDARKSQLSQQAIKDYKNNSKLAKEYLEFAKELMSYVK